MGWHVAGNGDHLEYDQYRVIQQTYGDGEYRYDVDPIESSGEVVSVYAVWVNNRAGHVKRLEYTNLLRRYDECFPDAPVDVDLFPYRLLRRVDYPGTLTDDPEDVNNALYDVDRDVVTGRRQS